MNRSTRTLLRASVLAPVAVALAFGAAPAEAGGDPIAQLAQDVQGARGLAGQALPGQAATLLDPVVKGPVATTDGVFKAARGTAAVGRAKDGAAQQATAELVNGVVNTAGARMIFSGLAAKCSAAADGSVRAATRVLGGKLTGPASSPAGTPAIPALPPENFKAPIGDPKTLVTLNKQVRDPLGGVTVSALSIKNLPAGASREFGVARCRPVEKAGKLAAGQAAELAGKSGKAGEVAELTGRSRRGGIEQITGPLGALTGPGGQGLPALGALGNPLVAAPAPVGDLAGPAGSALPGDLAGLAAPGGPAAPALDAAGALTAPGGPVAPALSAAAPGGPVSGLTSNPGSNLSSLLGGLPLAPVQAG